jgi:hypothetical protein
MSQKVEYIPTAHFGRPDYTDFQRLVFGCTGFDHVNLTPRNFDMAADEIDDLTLSQACETIENENYAV